jgi:hypothetical protein
VALAGRHASRRTSRVVHCYTTNSSTKKSGDVDTDPLKYFNTLYAEMNGSEVVVQVSQTH